MIRKAITLDDIGCEMGISSATPSVPLLYPTLLGCQYDLLACSHNCHFAIFFTILYKDKYQYVNTLNKCLGVIFLLTKK